MAAIPLVAIEAATGTTGSDGLAVFTFPADIDTRNHLIATDRLPQGDTIDYTVTGPRQITFIAGSIPLAGAKIWLWNGVQGTSVSTGASAWDTVAEVVSDAAIELGLVPAPIADPFASADANILQLLAYLKSGGRKLAKERPWSHLTSEYVFATVIGQAIYPLPSDFRGMIPQTGWDRTTQFETIGPLTPQEWQYTKARTIIGTLAPMIRFQGGQLSIRPTPTAVESIAFEYRSTSWVQPAGQTSPTSDAPAAATDVVCFDPVLAGAMLQLEWLAKKGFDTTTALAEFNRVLGQTASEDSPGRRITLGGRRGVLRRLGLLNMRDTGVGQ